MNSGSIGWWKYTALEDGLSRMDFEITGEAIVDCGPLVRDNLPPLEDGSEWRLFEYQTEFKCSLAVVVSPFWNDFTVDYNLSSALWREEGSSKDEYLAYGRWIRLDDTVLEAFRIWPHEKRSQSPVPHMGRLEIVGGWLNAEWRSGYHRWTNTFPWDIALTAFEHQHLLPETNLFEQLPMDFEPWQWEKGPHHLYEDDYSHVPGHEKFVVPKVDNKYGGRGFPIWRFYKSVKESLTIMGEGFWGNNSVSCALRHENTVFSANRVRTLGIVFDLVTQQGDGALLNHVLFPEHRFAFSSTKYNRDEERILQPGAARLFRRELPAAIMMSATEFFPSNTEFALLDFAWIGNWFPTKNREIHPHSPAKQTIGLPAYAEDVAIYYKISE